MEGRKAALSCSSSSNMNRRKSFNGKDLAEDHKGGEELDKEWLGICITAGGLLYGEYPIEVLEALYATKGETISKEQILEFLGDDSMMVCDGETISPVIVKDGEMLERLKEADKNGNPYASLHFDPAQLEVIRKENAVIQEQPYWMPAASQIEELAEQGYISTPAMERLEVRVREIGGDPVYLKELWAYISTGKMGMLDANRAVLSVMYADSDDGAEKQTANMPIRESLNATLPLVYQFLRGVNIRKWKGWPQCELKGIPWHRRMPASVPGSAHAAKTMKKEEPKPNAMGATVDSGSIDSFTTVGPHGERRVVKVGRNDPCPCGSGKKYKQCHGR